MKDNRSRRSTKFSKTLILSMALTTGLNVSNAWAQMPGGKPGQGGHLVPGSGSGGPNPTTPTTTPTAPPKLVLKGQVLEREVRDATRDFIQSVIAVYIPAYNTRYNLRQGLLDQSAEMGDLQAPYSAEYQQGKSSGQLAGVTAGQQRGKQDSLSWSKQMILNDIGREIDQAIATNGKVKFIKDPREAQDYQVTGQIVASAKSVSERLQADQKLRTEIDDMFSKLNESFFQRELRRSLLGDLAEIMNSERRDLPEKLRDDDRVFDLWLNREFVPSNAIVPGLKFYKEISDGNVYDNPAQNKESFRRGFINAVANGTKGGQGIGHGPGNNMPMPPHMMNFPGLETAWRNGVEAGNLHVYKIGQRYFKIHANEYKRQLGYNAGYVETYVENAENYVRDNHATDYSKQYPEQEQLVRTSSVITNVSARIVPSLGKTELGIGDFFDIVVSSAANRGMKAGNVQVELLQTQNVTVLQKGNAFPLEGFRKLQQPIQYNYVGQVADQTSPTQDMSLQASVGGYPVSVTVRLTFEGLVMNAAQTDNPGWTKHLMDKTIAWMSSEWDDTSGWNDQYEKKDAGKLIVKMYNLFNSGKLTEAEKDKIRIHGQAIRNVYGEKYDNLLKKDDWKAVNGMCNEMKLAGKMKGEK